MGIFGKRREGTRPHRLFYVTDVHGSSQAWRKLLAAAKIYKADALVCGGDIAGKRLYPILELGHDRYETTIDRRQLNLDGDDALAAVKKRIETGGGYWAVMPPDAAKSLSTDTTAMEKLFVSRIQDRLAEWIDIAEARLAGSDVRCYVTGGNDDSEDMLAPLRDSGATRVVAAEGRVVDVLGHEMVSVGWSNKTPWGTPRETTELRLAELIHDAAAQLDTPHEAIFNLHVPPKDSTLDTCPMLDTSQSPPAPVMKGGEIVMFGAGSTAVAEAIHHYQPLVSLHGHIHESAAVTRLGQTVCINPGSEYQHGALLGAIVLIGQRDVVNYQLTRG